MTKYEAKKLLVATLEVRGCCTDRELNSLPEFCKSENVLKFKVHELLDQLLDEYEIISVEFAPQDADGVAIFEKARAVYFPLGTTVFQPGISVKRGLLPYHVKNGLENFKKSGILNDDMMEGLTRSQTISFYDLIHKYVGKHQKLTATVLEDLIKEVRNASS